MKSSLTEDQASFRDITVRFLSNECSIAEVHRLSAADGEPGTAFWRRGADLGWTSLLVPESDGGGSVSENGVADLAIVADAFGCHVAPGPLLPTNVVAGAIARSPSNPHRDLLDGLLSGGAVATWCGSEHALGTGSTVARRTTHGFELSGRSSPVEAATGSDALLVTAATDDGLEQWVISTDAPGVNITPLSGLDSVRRFGEVIFDAVDVGEGARLVSSNSVAAEVERQLQDALVIQTAQMVGAAQRAFDFTLEWSFDRYTFGRPLASYQELKHRFADMKMWLEASHALVSALCHEVHAGAPSAAETASIAKAYLGQHLAELMQDCVQMHGGIGLTVEHDLHLYLRRVVTDCALFGSPRVHRQRVAAMTLDVAPEPGARA